MLWSVLVLALAGGVMRGTGAAADPYYGTSIGELSTLYHQVVGHVYALDNITIYIRGFTYDGEGPDAFFFAGNKTPEPSNKGFIIPDEKGSSNVLGPYKKKNIILKFPVTPKGQRSLNDVAWVSVWCRQFAVDFGNVKVPKDMTWPAPVKGGSLSSDQPFVSASVVTLKDTATIIVQDFSYDGSLEDAIFIVGNGNAQESGAQVHDEKGTTAPLKKYSKKNLDLTLPPEVRGQHIQYFGVWSPTEGMITSTTFPENPLIPPNLKSLQ